MEPQSTSSDQEDRAPENRTLRYFFRTGFALAAVAFLLKATADLRLGLTFDQVFRFAMASWFAWLAITAKPRGKAAPWLIGLFGLLALSSLFLIADAISRLLLH